MKGIQIAAMASILIIAPAGIVFGGEMPQGMDMETDASMQPGDNTIHNSIVEGYRLTYQLFDLKASGQAAAATNHLMVTITDGSGAPVENAKVGYFVTGPDGTNQKLMSMGMGGGYGANVNLGGAGAYVIKTKVVAGDVKLMDEFTYTAK